MVNFQAFFRAPERILRRGLILLLAGLLLTGPAAADLLWPEETAGQRMLKHQRLNETVFATTYENGVVYVNYGPEEAQLEGGIVIPAESARFVAGAQ